MEDPIMSKPRCGNCYFRGKYDQNPGSIIGRLWRWHIAWCPGWKAYMKSLTKGEKAAVLAKYNLPGS